MKIYKKSIFWFRQDLRIYDNTALFEAAHQSDQVLPIFILDTNLIPYFGWLEDKKFWFIREALKQVSQNLEIIWGQKVAVYLWKPEEIIPELVKKYEIDAVFVNESYGSYGKKRDLLIAEKIKEYKARFEPYKDFLLVWPNEVESRKVFTPFFKLWKKNIHDTEELSLSSFSALKITDIKEAQDFIPTKKHPFFTMDFWKKRFENLPLTSYEETRNNLDIDGTSLLSPYIRFWVFSIRQIYNKIKLSSNESFLSEIAWREFWWHIFHFFPETKNIEFQDKRRWISWKNDMELFEKWKNGETWYPVVDAAMKELKEKNWMHGRARMIVASFLTKDLHIDWRLGESYFKEMLLDYDEAVNLWNWQWSASVWADPKPLRIFNPILQSEKFSPSCDYIFKYIPELSENPKEAIHNPLEHSLDYINPIIDHRIETKKAREIYKKSIL